MSLLLQSIKFIIGCKAMVCGRQRKALSDFKLSVKNERGGCINLVPRFVL